MTELKLKNGLEGLRHYFEGFEKETPYVVFNVYLQDFGIEAAQVLEVIAYAKPVKVPSTTRCLEGALNLRGEMIPVFDLRKLMGLMAVNVDERTVILVVESKGRVFGLIADQIIDVVNMPESGIQPQPDVSVKYVRNVAFIENTQIFLLDVDQMVENDLRYRNVPVPELETA